MIFVAQAGDRKHEHIMESIETFGREVLPEFKERHETTIAEVARGAAPRPGVPGQFVDLARPPARRGGDAEDPMAKPEQVADPELRGLIESAHALMRGGKATDAVETLARAYLQLLAMKPRAARRDDRAAARAARCRR